MEQSKAMDLKKLKKEADDAYFNSGSPIMTDLEYDILFGTSTEVGCLPKTDKVKLPVYMGSLTKCNDDKTIDNFISKFNDKEFIVQEKLDGVSCLYICNKGQIKLFTRGNGVYGTEITHLLDYGLTIPKLAKSFMVRGELIVSKKIFEKEYQSKFKNIRNMVSGQVAKKVPDESIIKNIDFVGYEVIEPQKKQNELTVQLDFLIANNFKVVYNRILERDFLNQETLMDYLIRRKKKSDYEIDGLVLTITSKYVRYEENNPKYSFAFKIQGEVVNAEVKNVVWNLSKSGKYKPQIKINPVNLSGVTISSLTGFNAKYIVDNKICPGTILSIIRSGDVIPHITAIIQPGNGDVKLPANSKWNSVDLYHTFDTTPDEVIIKQMVYFFSSLKCLNCKDKTIFKIYESGKKTIESIIQASTEELSVVVGNKVASKILESIHERVKNASISELLAALNAFGEGIGLKKIQQLDLNNPENLQVKGLSEATIKEKILPHFKSSLDRVLLIKKMVGGEPLDFSNFQDQNGPLTGRIFVFTQFRDASLEKQISNLGGKVTTAISKKTTDLVVGVGKSSTKLIKAQSLGINIITKSDLIKTLAEIDTKKIEIDYSDYSESE
ncbi:NAD-dependent DNA ligase [Invertebrate iridescent virus 22]|uniref:DNA ligase (NAD(+)) n=1 Tax=Invertebrate iridescent virus 22 TaxID=345198 RepID=S6DB12_9VIRU|nr:NAD-dependent DNA ligase [Invertebrate iridescent virus 22]CCV01836.1 NAD-dependent DNA ligase [Invertebrate iridescent virus 22]